MHPATLRASPKDAAAAAAASSDTTGHAKPRPLHALTVVAAGAIPKDSRDERKTAHLMGRRTAAMNRPTVAAALSPQMAATLERTTVLPKALAVDEQRKTVFAGLRAMLQQLTNPNLSVETLRECGNKVFVYKIPGLDRLEMTFQLVCVKLQRQSQNVGMKWDKSAYFDFQKEREAILAELSKPIGAFLRANPDSNEGAATPTVMSPPAPALTPVVAAGKVATVAAPAAAANTKIAAPSSPLQSYYDSWEPYAVDLTKEMALRSLAGHERDDSKGLQAALRAVESNPAFNLAGFLRLRNATLKAVEKILGIPPDKSKVVKDQSAAEQRDTVIRRLVKLLEHLFNSPKLSTPELYTYGCRALAYEIAGLERIQQAFHELLEKVREKGLNGHQGELIIIHQKIRRAISAFLIAQTPSSPLVKIAAAGEAKDNPGAAASRAAELRPELAQVALNPTDDPDLREWNVLARSSEWILTPSLIRPPVREVDENAQKQG